MAAYYLMLRWVASGDTQWVATAARIVDAWSSTLVNFTGHDQMLASGIYGSHFAQVRGHDSVVVASVTCCSAYHTYRHIAAVVCACLLVCLLSLSHRLVSCSPSPTLNGAGKQLRKTCLQTFSTRCASGFAVVRRSR